MVCKPLTPKLERPWSNDWKVFKLLTKLSNRNLLLYTVEGYQWCTENIKSKVFT